MAQAEPGVKPPLNIRRIAIFAVVAVLLLLFVTGVLSFMGVWNTFLLEPMLNFLVLLSRYMFGSFGIAIIVLTVIIRIITLPLTIKQLRSTKAMQAMQPKMKELQKKYAKDQKQLNSEVMKLYKETGVNPLGCAGPMLIQFPIWIALYQSVIQALAYTPENLLGLSKHLYSWSLIQDALPLSHHFLLLDLTKGNIGVAILVAVSMWVLQKMSTQPAVDAQQQSMNRIMLWMMPLMFGFMSITFPSGLSVYWVVNNIIGILLQYRLTGWGDLKKPSLSSVTSLLALRRTPQQPAEVREKNQESSGRAKEDVKGGGAERKEAAGGDISSQRKKGSHGKHRGKRKN